MEKKITISGKEYTVKEMSYLDAVELPFNIEGTIESGKRREASIKMLKSCVGLTEEEIVKLTSTEGLSLQAVVNEVNGWTDFQKATAKKD
ncbi:MAG: hypothetical protein IH948_03035 [Bacteroidetes bacterium]|nr:hypothetical protein [Bacteroidota bacterium]